ncbi:forkhead box protein J1-like [Lampetra fluviatilis]
MPMPALLQIAARFQQSWQPLPPGAEDEARGAARADGGGGAGGGGGDGGGGICLDDSLTSLQWLQEFSIQGSSLRAPQVSPGGGGNSGGLQQLQQLLLLQQDEQQLQLQQQQQRSGPAPCSPPAGDTAGARGTPACTPQRPACGRSREGIGEQQGGGRAASPVADEVDYRTDASVKPPYSYATLICMAMRSTHKSKVTLASIYKWIMDNFCYYRHADPTWRNSIRHNLSLNKCFVKVPRQKDEPGKGGFWAMDPQYSDLFENGMVRRRRRVGPANFHGAGGGVGVSAPPAPGKSGMWNARHYGSAWETPLPGAAHGPCLADDPRGSKRKQPLPKRLGKMPRTSSPVRLPASPFAGPDDRARDHLRADLDWQQVLEDMFHGDLGGLGEFELSPPLTPESGGAAAAAELDVDLTIHGHHIDRPSEWCCGQAGLDSLLVQQSRLHQQLYHHHQQQQHHHHHQQQQQQLSQPPLGLDEELALAVSSLRHPWEEIHDDDLLMGGAVSLAEVLDFSDGFSENLSQWDSSEASQ